MKTAGEIIALMQHRIGKTPAAGHSLWDDLNAAGEELYTHHDWSWRVTGPAALVARAGQEHLKLPHDWGNLMEAWIPDIGVFNLLNNITLHEYARIKSTESVGYALGTLHVYWPAYESISAEDPPEPRALIFPTPTTDGIPTVQVVYKRVWREIDEDDDAARPNVPQRWMNVLADLAVAIAWRREMDSLAPEEGKAAEAIARLVLEDSRTPGRTGIMTGGAGRRLRHGVFRDDNRRPFNFQP